MTVLPQLERDLFNAAEQRLGASATATRRRSTSGAPLILSAAVALGVAAVALLVLGRGHYPVQSTTPSASSGGSSRDELIRTFGVLRRPQTKSDLDHQLLGPYVRNVGRHRGILPAGPYVPLPGPKAFLKDWGYPELDRRLARVVNIPAWPARVLVAPTTFQPSPPSTRRFEGVNLTLWVGSKSTVPPSSLGETGPRPTSVGAVLSHGLAFADPVDGKNLIDGIVLVPDGVVSVELGPFALLPDQTPPGVSAEALRTALSAIHVTATVGENVAAFQVAMPVLSARPPRPVPSVRGWVAFGIGTQVRETWLDARGQVVKRTPARLDFVVRLHLLRAR